MCHVTQMCQIRIESESDNKAMSTCSNMKHFVLQSPHCNITEYLHSAISKPLYYTLKMSEIQ